MTDVSEAWNILVKNVSSTLDRNEVERFVVDPVVLIPSGLIGISLILHLINLDAMSLRIDTNWIWFQTICHKMSRSK